MSLICEEYKRDKEGLREQPGRWSVPVERPLEQQHDARFALFAVGQYEPGQRRAKLIQAVTALNIS
jgi:hypothetical protein